MTIIETRIKRWGNSLGVIIPSEAVIAKKLKEDDKITILVMEDSKKVLRDMFGLAKGKTTKSGQNLKDESRKELY